jgi:hypothetical protein
MSYGMAESEKWGSVELVFIVDGRHSAKAEATSEEL